MLSHTNAFRFVAVMVATNAFLYLFAQELATDLYFKKGRVLLATPEVGVLWTAFGASLVLLAALLVTAKPTAQTSLAVGVGLIACTIGVVVCNLTGTTNTVAWVYPIMWPATGGYLLLTPAPGKGKQAQE